MKFELDCFKNKAHNAGERVSALIPLNAVDIAIVKANCLYNCPVIPPMKAVGTNTASRTNTSPIIGP